jgi:hypothetical protein
MSQIEQVAKDLSDFKLPDEYIEHIKSEFYRIMKENEVYQGTRSADGVGVLCNNFEWTMCQTMFVDVIKRQIEWSMVFDEMTVKEG